MQPMTRRNKARNIAIAVTTLAIAGAFAMQAPASARQGADDPASHHVKDDRVVRIIGPITKVTTAAKATTSTTIDDRGRRHGGHGADN